MLARSPLPPTKEFHIIVTVVSLRVTTPVKPESFAAATIDVQYIINKKHPHRLRDRNQQNFLLHTPTVLQRDPGHRLPTLPTQEQAALRIIGQTNPRSMTGTISLQDMIHFEPRQRRQ